MPMEFGSHAASSSRCSRAGRAASEPALQRGLAAPGYLDRRQRPYHGNFINKRLPQMPYDLANDAQVHQKIAAVHARRCAECHDAAAVSRLDWIDLSRPEHSRFLAAPLAKTASGLGKCAKPVYQDTSDPDYRALRELVESSVRKARELPRRDVKAFLQDNRIDRGSLSNGTALSRLLVSRHDNRFAGSVFPRVGLTSASADPVVATLFATTALQHGEAVVYAIPVDRLSGRVRDNRQGNRLAALEAEFVIEASPSEVASPRFLSRSQGTSGADGRRVSAEHL